MVIAILASFSVYFFCNSVKRKFGEMVGTITFVLIVFNSQIIYFMNRVSLDTTMAILNLIVFALWLESDTFLMLYVAVSLVFFFFSHLKERKKKISII